jgi:hypothetical protein
MMVCKFCEVEATDMGGFYMCLLCKDYDGVEEE